MESEQSVMAVIRASRPTFRNPYDKLAFAVHSSFFASGYLLLATGPTAFSNHALSSTSTDEVGIDQWNQLDSIYCFLYSNPNNNSNKVWVKCLVVNAASDYLFVDALTEGPNSQSLNLALRVRDFDNEDGGRNYISQYRNFGRLVRCVKREILHKLNLNPLDRREIQTPRAEPRYGDNQHHGPIRPFFPSCSPHPGVVFYPIHPGYPVPFAAMYPLRGLLPRIDIYGPHAFPPVQDNRNPRRAGG
ncbi:hypothetical protein Vadar_021562 [Vaccinium darrowii]|uniref:Uncharacterized protein n=1 Tax=Vaccinium darrowii TaxID=229202 RepID=A0ACB7XTI6_9ERIC|nr:hypothetical protein Vadar_021562 [Vaccinium darrowii]